MCIAILKTIGGTITKEQLDNSYKKNPDGCGFSYVDENNKLVIYKEMVYTSFYKKLMESFDLYGSSSPFIIHFRIATEGGINLDNCHPFYVSDDTVFCHNGIISGLRKESGYSDTRIFNEDVLKNLDKDFQSNDGIMRLLDLSIGYSKLIFINKDKSYSLVGEEKGEWVNGVWFSNSGYKEEKRVVKYGSYNMEWNAKERKWEENRREFTPQVKSHGSAFVTYKKKQEEKVKLIEVKREKKKKKEREREWEHCMYCEELDQKKYMHLYTYEGESDWYCEGCVELMLDNELIDRRDVPTYFTAEEKVELDKEEKRQELEKDKFGWWDRYLRACEGYPHVRSSLR